MVSKLCDSHSLDGPCLCCAQGEHVVFGDPDGQTVTVPWCRSGGRAGDTPEDSRSLTNAEDREFGPAGWTEHDWT